MVRRFVRLLKLTSFCVAVCLPIHAFAFTAPGNPSGYVNDFAQVLTVEQKNILEQKLAAFNASTTNEITIVTVQSLNGDYIEHYAIELFKAWGIGTSKRDNGVLLLIAVNEHKMRIEVGYGLEGTLTDATASQIIRNDLTPAFKQNDFYGGMSRAIDSIIKATQGEYVSDGKTSSSWFQPSLEGVFMFLLIITQLFGSILARSKSWWAGGILGAIFGFILTQLGFFGSSLLTGGIVTVLFVLFGLLFDYVVSNAYTQSVRSGSSVPWWAGGGRGGSSGGSSFGGFGGGRSGGGGSSGGW
jgi:uncharacterized protein